MSLNKLETSLLELIRRTSAFLPHDVEQVITLNKKLEEKGSKADFALDMVIQNIGLAKKRSLPLCQDTGTITFYVKAPPSFNQIEFKNAAKAATVTATEVGYLRQNSVDSITGKNSGNNLGPGSPVFHFEQWEKQSVDVRLILKGGGCENMSTQYKLPATFAGTLFGRDLNGVKACIMDAIYQAQGKGCSPGFLGVCIGGDRATGYEFAKDQLLREIDDVNPDEKLAQMEEEILQQANNLEIGPMGFGGKLTMGSCKIGARNRLPASFFVTVAYMCWAYRRRGFVLSTEGDVKEWLYQVPGEFEKEVEGADTFLAPTENVTVLNTPVSEKDIRSLNVGDVVLINGTIFTGRDAVHKYLHDGGELDVIKGGIIYHCGPVVLEKESGYQVMAAGPTTSIREEPYQAGVIEKFGIKAVIGKGGMGAKTSKACKDFGAVYLHAIGGAAQVYALSIKDVPTVSLKEFGSPEAVWEFRVEGFPAVVTMDSKGKSLHKDVEEKSRKQLDNILA
jgi:fumarate hydratase, class I